VIDVSDPTSPTIVGRADLPGGVYGSGNSVALAGSHAYVTGGDLHVIDVSGPASPTVVGSTDTPGDAEDVAIAGSYAYVADGSSGLQVIDVSDPTLPTIVGSTDTPGYGNGVAVAGSYAYVADGSAGLQVIDVSSPASPTIVGSTDTPDCAYGVVIATSFAFVADGISGLQVIDVSDPTSPTIVGSVETQGIALSVAVAGSYAYVCVCQIFYWTGLQVIDVSDPDSPTIVGSVETPGAVGVAVAGSFAYVADGSSGLQVIDVSDPTLPTIVGSTDSPGYGYGVAVAGSYAYVAADSYAGLKVIDVSDPSSPAVLGRAGTPGAARGVAVEGSYAYVADGRRGLQVLPEQCEDPDPVELAWFEVAAVANSVTITWETSIETDHLGFHIDRAKAGSDHFERLNRDLVPVAGESGRRYEFIDRAVIGGETYAYRLVAVDLTGGEQWFDLGSATVGRTPPSRLVLHQNHPNPFNPTTRITFELPHPGHVSLRIYDVGGHVVRTLFDGRLGTDTREIEWDGRDNHGSRLGSGVYFYCLRTGDQSLTRKLVMIE
jgi:hypothetical protein